MAQSPYFHQNHFQATISNFSNLQGAFGSANSFSQLPNSSINHAGPLYQNGDNNTLPYMQPNSPVTKINYQFDIGSMQRQNSLNHSVGGGPDPFHPKKHGSSAHYNQQEQMVLSSNITESVNNPDSNQLFELPIESLLQVTQPEERLIKENSIVEHMFTDGMKMYFKGDNECDDQVMQLADNSSDNLHSPDYTTSSSCSPLSSPFSPHESVCSPQNIVFSHGPSKKSPYSDSTGIPNFSPKNILCTVGSGSEKRPKLNHESEMFSSSSYAYQSDHNLDFGNTNRMQDESLLVKDKKKSKQKSFHKNIHHGSKTFERMNDKKVKNDGSDSIHTLHQAERIGNETNLSTSTFVPQLECPEITKPPQPRKRMKASAIPPEKKICGVCGDMAKNMHFGGLACDSCKAFFRRSVQSGAHDSFKCNHEEKCIITKGNRRSCQFCRFKKCQTTGMQINWVMTENDRMTLYKNRLAKTRQIQKDKEVELVYGDLPRSLDEVDAKVLNELLSKQHYAFSSLPYPNECNGDSINTLSNIFVVLCKKFGKFFFEVDDFNKICQEDRTKLLKSGIAMALYICGAHLYDPVNQCFPADCIHESVKVPHVSLKTVQDLAQVPDAFDAVLRFYSKYECDLKDNYVSLLMYLVVLFLPEHPFLNDAIAVQETQEKYKELLQQYLVARDGWQNASRLYLKLMEGLGYVKEILKFHAVVDIKPTINHIDTTSNVSFAQPMKNLICQIQKAFQGEFSQYSSVFNHEQKTLTDPISDKGVVAKLSRSLQFGESFCTDEIIASPFQSLIESDNKEELSRTQVQLGKCRPAIEAGSSNCKLYEQDWGIGAPKSNMSSIDTSVNTVCDILKRLSHTDDAGIIRNFKDNIPVDLLKKLTEKLEKN